ncbi:Transcriptional regulatory protein YehT [compost metagenome]
MQIDFHKQIKAIIVDDEQDGREVLSHLISVYAPNVVIVGQAEDADTACELIDQLQPHLVFLDIQMVGKNGFSVLETYNKIDFEVIFVTSYEQYSLTAIKFNALDYLLKPLDIDELKASINKATNRIGTKLEYEARIKNLLENLNRKQTPKKIAVHLKDSVHMVNLAEVMYIEADGNYCHIFTQQNQTYMTTRMLKEFEEYLGEQSSFVRINKSILANPDFIVKYSKGEPCILTMENSQTFEVSRRKKQEILDKLNSRKAKK